MKNQSLKLSDARRRTPPVDPVAAMRESLQVALFGAVKESDVLGMVEKLKAIALDGDLRAMKMFFGLVVGQAPQQAVQVNQVTVHPQADHEVEEAYSRPIPIEARPAPAPAPGLRLDLANLVRAEGPMKAGQLAARLGVSTASSLDLLNGDPWFAKEQDGWHLTARCHAEAFGREADE